MPFKLPEPEEEFVIPEPEEETFQLRPGVSTVIRSQSLPPKKIPEPIKTIGETITGLHIAGQASREGLLNLVKRIGNIAAQGGDVLGLGIEPPFEEKTEMQQLAGALRKTQTLPQNILAGATGAAPFLIPGAGQALFAADIATQPEHIPEQIKGIGQTFKDLATITAVRGERDRAGVIERFRQHPVESAFNILLPASVFVGGVKAPAKIAKKVAPLERLVTPEKQPVTPVVDAKAPLPIKPVRLTEKAKAKLERAGIVPPPSKGIELGAIGAPETVKALGESVSKSIQSVSNLTKEMIDKTKTPPVILRGVKQAKEVMIEHDRQIRRAESTNKLFEKTVKDAVVEPDRQMMILHAVEHDMKGPFWNKLSPQEKAIANWAAKEKTKLDQFIRDNEVFTTMDMTPGLRHISHWWKNPKTGEPYRLKFGKFAKVTPLAKQRTILTFAKGMNATPDNPMGSGGLVPASTNIGRIIGESWESVMRAHQSREMFKTLGKIQAETDVTIQRKPGAKPGQIRMVEQWDKLTKQGLAEDYVRASDMGPNARSALSKKMPIEGVDGKITFIDKDVGVHKNIAPFVKAYIENPTYTNFDKVNFATKSLKLGFSMFHVVSLGMQELANFRVPFYNIKRGLGLRTELGETVRLLHREGLELHKGYEDLGTRNKFFEGTTKAGRVGNIITKPVELMRNFIFDVVQPGMKTSFAVDTYNKILPKYLRKGLTEKRAARDAVKAADGHFSGEHYKRALLETNRWMSKMYFSPEARKFWQRTLLSPTWQREHLLVGKNVAKSFMTDKMIKRLGLENIGPIKAEYRKYALGAIAMVGAVNMWNLMSTQRMDGKAKHLWQNPKSKGFAVRAWWDEPSYTLTDKNGKTRTIRGGPAYIRPLKSVFELAEGATDPIKKASYKIAPFLQAIINQFPNNKFRRYGGALDIPKRTLDFVTDVSTPIVADQFADWVKDKKTFWSVTAPFFGMPVSKVKKRTGTLGAQQLTDEQIRKALEGLK